MNRYSSHTILRFVCLSFFQDDFGHIIDSQAELIGTTAVIEILWAQAYGILLSAVKNPGWVNVAINTDRMTTTSARVLQN